MNSNQRLISFELKAEMGFFKKPDINEDIYLTYNMLHKPALLGILGAILGMQGYKKNGEFPKYYDKLKYLKVGIQPLESNKGNYTKEIVSYNNSTGLASNEEGGNLIVTEQILLKPEYCCYLLLNIENEYEKTLYNNIFSYNAEFLPYLGKNEFSAWWVNVKDYGEVKKFDFEDNYKIATIFVKTDSVSKYIAHSMSMYNSGSKNTFLYFERLPICFDKMLYQYSYADFVYSNHIFNSEMNMSELGDFYKIEVDNRDVESIIVQLF